MSRVGDYQPRFPAMNALIRIVLMTCFGLLLVSPVRGTDQKLRVEGRQDLRLAIVDSNRNNPSRAALHEAFALGLAEAINAGGGAPISVKTKVANPDHAAFNLGTGIYDAVLVIGTSLPRPLILSETTRLTATLSAGKKERKAYLIFGQGDEGLTKVLTGAFASAITYPKFLDTLDGGIDPDEATAVAAR